MANDLNSCSFIGRLGKDVEVIEMNNGESLSKFSVAVGESYKNRQGEKVDNVEWINVIAYRKLGEICSRYLRKGSQIHFSGKLNTNKYTGKDGVEKLSVQIIADKMQMLGSKSDNEQEHKKVEPEKVAPEPFDDDIPF